MEDNYNNDQFGFELKRALLEDTPLPDADKAFMQFKKNIGVKESRWKTLRPYLAVAMAACIAALCYLVLPLGEEDKMASSRMQQQLAKMGDVVYMAREEKNVISLCVDGKMIDLAANSRSSKSGFVLTSDNVIRMFDVPKDNHDEAVITVPHGQMATIMLNDSTKVTLNAGSTFAFPCHFDKDGFRKVKLQGEGYFEVKHDEQHPFVVNGKQLDVTVLGTVFDVRNFDQEQARVALLQGKVNVEVAKQQTILEPGQVATVGTTGFVTVEDADLEQVLGWKNGLFYFDGQSLHEIMLEMGRWYNMSIVFASSLHIDERLHFSMERTASAEEAIRQLQLICSAKIQIKQKQNTILVK